MGDPGGLTAKTWGFYDVSFGGRTFAFQRPYGSYVMENVLFKISFPAEFHGQTGAEAAITLHRELAKAGRSAVQIRRITIRTQRACIRSEEHTSELQSLMRISYAVFCLKKKKRTDKDKESDTTITPT